MSPRRPGLLLWRGLSGFKGRSSFKTWLFAILMNIARKRGRRERDTVPLPDLVRVEMGGRHAAAVDPDRFLYDHSEWPGRWRSTLVGWAAEGEERLMSSETMRCIADAMASLPPAQREVMRLRDIEGWQAAEVSGTLGSARGTNVYSSTAPARESATTCLPI